MTQPTTSTRIEAGAASFRLQPEPIFRFDNAVERRHGRRDLPLDRRRRAGPRRPSRSSGIPDGRLAPRVHLALDRPVRRRGRARSRPWRPAAPGLAFRPVPDAPKPAATPEASGSARCGRSPRTSRPRTTSRARAGARSGSCPSPVLRYGKAGSGVEDGALFCLRPEDRPRGLPDDRGPPRARTARPGTTPWPDDLGGAGHA